MMQCRRMDERERQAVGGLRGVKSLGHVWPFQDVRAPDAPRGDMRTEVQSVWHRIGAVGRFLEKQFIAGGVSSYY